MASAQLLEFFSSVEHTTKKVANAYFAPPSLRSGSAKHAQSCFDRTVSCFDRTATAPEQRALFANMAFAKNRSDF
jgi:hypothetical protein